MPGSAFAQTTSGGASVARGGLDITTAATVAVGFIFLLLVVLVVITVRRRLEDQRAREAMAEAAFEMEVLASLRTADTQALPSNGLQETPPAPQPALEPRPEASASEAASLAESAPETPSASQVQTASPSSGPGLLQTADIFQERADVAASGVLSQLRHAGMISDIDGYMEVNGNARGAVTLRMKDGRRALLVPYHETEVFTRRNLRRFDLLIYVGRDGKAVVVNSLENMIADRVASRF